MSKRSMPNASPTAAPEQLHSPALPCTCLPSVHDLGLAYAAATKENAAALEPTKRTPKTANHMDWVHRTFRPRSDALRNLIVTLPAQTLADVVVQLGVIFTHLATEAGDGGDGSEAAERRCMALGETLDRIALSCLMVVAREARVDLNALDLWDAARLYASRFAGMGGMV